MNIPLTVYENHIPIAQNLCYKFCGIPLPDTTYNNIKHQYASIRNKTIPEEYKLLVARSARQKYNYLKRLQLIKIVNDVLYYRKFAF